MVPLLILAAVVLGACLLLLMWPMRPAFTGRRPKPNANWTARKSLADHARESAPATGKRYLVVGTGSLGLAIMDALLERGEKHVAGFDIAGPRRTLRCSGASFIRGSVTDYTALKEACQGIDVVFLTVAIIRYYERLAWQYAASHAVNVTGTANVIRACVECGVQVLVQTSSSNVCIAPGLAHMNMDESSPYVDASNSPNHYGWTKVQAERAVLEAHGTELSGGRGRLAAATARPCSAIFGPGDNFITQKFLDQGSIIEMLPEPKIDYVFTENVVWGHLLLEKHLHLDPSRVGGSAFCISNEEPLVADDFYHALAHYYEQATGKPMKITYLPRGLVHTLAWVSETCQRLTGRRISGELALITPAMFNLARLSYVFPSRRAREVLGYEPIYTFDEAMQRTVALWHSSSVKS